MHIAGLIGSVNSAILHCAPPKKCPPFYFVNNSVKKLTDFNNFGTLNPEKI